jgi:hypothetical protein
MIVVMGCAANVCLLGKYAVALEEDVTSVVES